MYELSIRVITRAEEWELIRNDWNALLAESDYNNIFLTFEWLKTWWNIFGSGELSIIIFECKSKIISILPLYIRKAGFIRILRFIGTGVSDYGCFIIDKTYPASQIYHQAFDYIFTNLQWDIIDLQQISELTSLYHYLKENTDRFADRQRLDVKLNKLGKCFYMPRSDDSFIPYNARNFCSKILKRGKKLMRLGNVVYSEVQNIDLEILQRFFEMHIKKWRKCGKVSDFAFHKYRKFHSEISKIFARNSWLSFTSTKFNDRYIAFTYAFKYNSKIYYYIQTYDPDFAKYSPGHFSFLNYLNLVKNSDCKEVDLLRGEEEYKLCFTKQYRENYRFIIFKRSVKGMVYKFYTFLMDRLYHTKHFRGITRYLYRLFRQCKLLFKQK